MREERALDTVVSPSRVEANIDHILCSPSVAQQLQQSFALFREELTCDFQALMRDLRSEFSLLLQGAQMPDEALLASKKEVGETEAGISSPPVQMTRAPICSRDGTASKSQMPDETLATSKAKIAATGAAVSSAPTPKTRTSMLSSGDSLPSSISELEVGASPRSAQVPDETGSAAKANVAKIGAAVSSPPSPKRSRTPRFSGLSESFPQVPDEQLSASKAKVAGAASKFPWPLSPKTLSPTPSLGKSRPSVQSEPGNRQTSGLSMAAYPTTRRSVLSVFMHSVTKLDTSAHAQKIRMVGSRLSIMENFQIEEFNVQQLYHTSGVAQFVVRSKLFNCSVLVMIALSVMYMGIDANTKDNGRLADSSWKHQAIQHVFSCFFTFEILIRFGAFVRKCDAVRDHWFVVDSLLVLDMLVENYVFGFFLPKNLDSVVMDLFRLVRLLRLARFTRLMRASSDMVTMIKAIYAGTRAAVSTIIMLFVLTYSFALALHSLLKDEPSMQSYFGDIPRSMWTLLLQGIFMDGIGNLFVGLRAIHAPLSIGFVLSFVFFSTYVVVSILLGIFCEVVSKVAEAEEQSGVRSEIRQKLFEAVQMLDVDSNGRIDKGEFFQLFQDPDALAALQDLNIDTDYVQLMADLVFTSAGTQVPIPTVMNFMLRYRTRRPCLMGDLMGVVKCYHVWTGQAQQKISVDIKRLIHAEIFRAFKASKKWASHPGSDAHIGSDLNQSWSNIYSSQYSSHSGNTPDSPSAPRDSLDPIVKWL